MLEQDLVQRFASSGARDKTRILRQLQDSQGQAVVDLYNQALHDNYSKVRELALNILSRRHELAPEQVLDCLQDPSRIVQRTALRLMQNWPDARYCDYIQPFLQHSQLNLRLLAIEWFSRLGSKAAPFLQPLLHDSQFSVREKVKLHLSATAEPRESEASKPHAQQPLKAVPHFNTKSAEFFETHLEEIFQDGSSFKEEKLRELLSREGTRLGPPLIRLFESPRWDRRESILKILTRIEDFPTVMLHPMLEHPLWYVRAVGIKIIGSFKDPILLDFALVFVNDSNIEVRKTLAEVLPLYGRREEALLALEKLSIDEHFSVRRAARSALLHLRSQPLHTDR